MGGGGVNLGIQKLLNFFYEKETYAVCFYYLSFRSLS